MISKRVSFLIILSLAGEVFSQTQRRTRGSSQLHQDVLEKGQAEVEAWERWLKDSSNSVPSPVPPKKPAPTPCIGTPSELLEILSKVSTRADLLRTGSPQNEAYNWLLKDKFYCYSDPKLIQRYIMALTYFSTDGDKWTNCGEDGTCDPAICKDFGRKPRLGGNRWLSNGTECEWCGAACNTTNKCITDIDLGKLSTYFQTSKRKEKKPTHYDSRVFTITFTRFC
jgi:hypothetical protein